MLLRFRTRLLMIPAPGYFEIDDSHRDARSLLILLDTLIAAHALSLGATLVTANEGEFRRVDTLAIENWGRS